MPFEDLKALVHPRASMRVIDLGCGMGAMSTSRQGATFWFSLPIVTSDD